MAHLLLEHEFDRILFSTDNKGGGCRNPASRDLESEAVELGAELLLPLCCRSPGRQAEQDERGGRRTLQRERSTRGLAHERHPCPHLRPAPDHQGGPSGELALGNACRSRRTVVGGVSRCPRLSCRGWRGPCRGSP